MRLSPDAMDALKVLFQVCDEHGCRFTVIGASALNIYAGLQVLPEPLRTTRDVDAVVSAEDWEDYSRLIELLLQAGFRQERGESEHAVFFGDARLDLLPIGGALLDGDRLTWPKSGMTMHVSGLERALDMAEAVRVEDLDVPVVPLWLFAYLKMVAFADRRNFDDLEDLLHVLLYYEERDGADSRRFDVHEESVYYETSGAYLVGMDIARNLGPDGTATLSAFFDVLREGPPRAAAPSVRREIEEYLAGEELSLLRALELGLAVGGATPNTSSSSTPGSG